MTLTGLAVRNLRRNKFRVALTVLGVAIAILTFLILRTETRAWLIGSTFAVQGRVVTRHKMTFILPLPKRYVQVVRDAPHVRVATWAQWFAGNDPKHEKEPFSAFAVDPATYFTVFVEAKVAPEALEAFQRDRGGAIVGDLLARKMGWNVGDRITLTSNYLPAALQLAIDGWIGFSMTATPRRSLKTKERSVCRCARCTPQCSRPLTSFRPSSWPF
jgi:putative ABC transport system permease protein